MAGCTLVVFGAVDSVDSGTVGLAAFFLEAVFADLRVELLDFAVLGLVFLAEAALTTAAVSTLSSPGVGLAVQTQAPLLNIQAWPIGAS